MTITFRPATLTDYEGIAACLARNGMMVWSRQQWLAFWDTYPYRDEFAGVPRGFVLETGGEIVGSISNIWAKYSLQGRDLRVAISGNAAVDPAHRAGSIKLMGETVRQSGVDVYLNGTPSDVASKIMDTLKVRRVPQADYDVWLLWAIRGRALARAGLLRRNVPLAGVFAWPIGVGLRVMSSVYLRRGAGGTRRDRVTLETSFSDEFDGLWAKLKAGSQRLLSFRDAKTLRWRYGQSISPSETRVLSIRRDGELSGYVVLLRKSHPRLGVVSYCVHDLQCVGDEAGLTRALLRAAWDQTRADSLDALEWIGFAGEKRRAAEAASRLRYRYPVWQAYYFTRDPSLKQELASPDRWDFSSFDADDLPADEG